jgi:CBS-domain-containing membrane protein
MSKFIKYRISEVPVVNEKRRLLGVISEADCMKEVSESCYFNLPILDKSVSKFMTTKVDTIEASKTIFEATSYFFKNFSRAVSCFR